MLTSRSSLALVGAALLIGGLTGCAATATVGDSGAVAVALSEYRVTPQKIDSETGAMVITVHNYGRLSHDLVISRGGEVLASTEPIGPGQTAELATALAPGTYLMASTILNDQALGAYGTLVVR